MNDLLVLRSPDAKRAFGKWGTAVFRTSACPRFQVWHPSNGRDIIFVTHICCDDPDPDEVAEVLKIVNRVNLAENPWWRFW